ncbi:MAG: hypothetical protein F6K41_29360, partial [Symploca sp. SIO3E6]|nr:hypothetical protein [Caldora sp. SIO3E6]
MTLPQEDLNTNNQESLNTLARAIAISAAQGQFSPILARCNYTKLREHLLQQLRESCTMEFLELVLAPSDKSIYDIIEAKVAQKRPRAIIISGLELVNDLNTLLIAINYARDEFGKNFPFPVVFWVTDEVLKKFIRIAPDFQSWAATPIFFELATEELVQNIKQTTDEIFAHVLEAGAGRFVGNAVLHLSSSHRCKELASALENLRHRGVQLELELEASLEFVLAQGAGSATEAAKQHYERSLELWRQCYHLFYQGDRERTRFQVIERKGCVLFYLGLWWRHYATQHRAEYDQACIQVREYFQQAIELFQQHERPDLERKFINALGEILQRLKQWEELEEVANRSLQLHCSVNQRQTQKGGVKKHYHLLRLAQAHGLWANVALSKSACSEAKKYAEEALRIQASIETSGVTDNSQESHQYLNWVLTYYHEFYLLYLARSLVALEQKEEAIQNLERARVEGHHHHDPLLYIDILKELRSLYYEQGEYLKAFETKQEYQSIEQSYGFHAFVGASPLQPKQQVTNPIISDVDVLGSVTQEIAASGRLQDVECLVEQMGRIDHKLTVIHGQSGVGKSSIIQAGLIPALKGQAIDYRQVLPVLQQVYTDWEKELGKSLGEALAKTVNSMFEPKNLDSTVAIREQLRNNAQTNLLTVLIFDQFEEFFFICKDQEQRQEFYDFLNKCLDIPYVKIILSLREDYLYYLLECNNRLVNFTAINNNILDKKILYYLGNFVQEDAKLVIQNFIEPTPFSLEPALIEQLVADLAGELGEVRPIELQVVGAQLQTAQVKTLAEYQAYGNKEKLVEQFLDAVIQDCGAENKQATDVILYLLTDDNNTRPVKTHTDLASALATEVKALNLILQILVGSGLVLRLPTFPNEQYQLVHDYLVPLIRRRGDVELLAKLKDAEEQQALTEAKFNRVLSRRLLEARLAVGVVAITAIIIALIARVSQTTNQIVRLTASSEALLEADWEFDALLESLKAGQTLKTWFGRWTPDDTRIRAIRSLQLAYDGAIERNGLQGYDKTLQGHDKTLQGHDKTLQGHDKKVFSATFSPDGNILASASEDTTVKLWDHYGKHIRTLRGHEGSVTSVNFSPDGKKIVSASNDKTIKVWSREGECLLTLKGYKGHVNESECPLAQKRYKGYVNSVGFRDNQTIAFATNDKTIYLWQLDNTDTFLKIFPGHSGGIYSVSFSPDGQMI